MPNEFQLKKLQYMYFFSNKHEIFTNSNKTIKIIRFLIYKNIKIKNNMKHFLFCFGIKLVQKYNLAQTNALNNVLLQ